MSIREQVENKLADQAPVPVGDNAARQDAIRTPPEAQPETPAKPHSIRIKWGMESSEQDWTEYSFPTAELLNAFMQGVDEASGWMEYDTLEQNEDGSWPEPETDEDEDTDAPEAQPQGTGIYCAAGELCLECGYAHPAGKHGKN